MTEIFAKRLRWIRTIRQMTQNQVADAVSITRSAYSSYERGISEPDLRVLIALARYFDVTTDFLVGNDLPSNSSLLPDKLKNELIEKITMSDAETVQMLLSLFRKFDRE